MFGRNNLVAKMVARIIILFAIGTDIIYFSGCSFGC